MSKRPIDASREVAEVVAHALAEDVGSGDVTSEAVVPAEMRARASILQKQPGVLFGLEAAHAALLQSGAANFDPLVLEGQWREEVPVTAARASGPARALLTGERVALNLLGHLSGVATLTALFVREVEGSRARILDTRKTTPGLRFMEKAAVAAGGGHNHRMGLDDAILIKDNHAALAGGVGEAIRRAREAQPEMAIEVECASMDQVLIALGARALLARDTLLLDNMGFAELREAVAAVRDAGEGAPRIEASGGITLDNVSEIATTGVDFISVGALTHSAPVLDVSMEIQGA